MASDAIAEFSELEGFVTAEQFDTLMFYIREAVEVLGNVYGLLIFFAVVLLCYFVYKFFRMFF